MNHIGTKISLSYAKNISKGSLKRIKMPTYISTMYATRQYHRNTLISDIQSLRDLLNGPYQERDFDKLSEIYQQVKLYDDKELYYAIGKWYYNSESYDMAVDCFDLCFKDFDGSMDFDQHYWYGRTLWRVERTDEALEHIRECVNMDPTNVMALNEMGMVYNAMNESSTGVHIFLEALNLEPENVTTLVNISEIYQILADTEKCVEYGYKAHQISENIKTITNLASALMYAQKNDEAIAVIKSGLDMDPKNYELLQYMGDIHASSEKKLDIYYYHIAEKVVPPAKAWLINFKLGFAYTTAEDMDKNFRKGMAYLFKSDQLNPNNGDILLQIAEATTRTGDYKSADYFYQRAIAADPTNPAIAFAFIKMRREYRGSAAAQRLLNNLAPNYEGFDDIFFMFESMLVSGKHAYDGDPKFWTNNK